MDLREGYVKTMGLTRNMRTHAPKQENSLTDQLSILEPRQARYARRSVYIFFLAERKHHCDSFHSVHLFATKRSRSPIDICTIYQQADGIDALFSNVPFRNSAFVWTRLEFKKQIVNVYFG